MAGSRERVGDESFYRQRVSCHEKNVPDRAARGVTAKGYGVHGPAGKQRPVAGRSWRASDSR